MSLLVLHFIKPDPKDEDAKPLQPSTIQENLLEFFKEEYSDVEAYLDLKNQKEAVAFHKYVTAIRTICAEILVVKWGMQIYQFQSRDDDEIFMKIRCDDQILKQQAHRTKYSMVHKIEYIEEFKEIPPSSAFNIRQEGEFADLKNIDRIRLMNQIIKEHIVVNNLIKNEILIDFYPLHEQSQIELFKKDLLGPPSPFISYDIDRIRNYFGERTMFYFLWMKFYTEALLIPSILGCLLFILSWIFPNDSYALEISEMLFAFVLSFWSAWFAISWSRIQNYRTLRYATVNCKALEEPRPEFQGTTRLNPITGEKELYFNEKTRIKRQAISFFTMSFLMGGIVATVVAIFMYRAILMFASENADESWGPFIAATLSTFQVRVFNAIYERVAVKLTDWENYKTQPEYDDALVIKVFLYQAIDNYIPLIYIAFFQAHYEGCDNQDCLAELNYQLWITVGWNMLLNVQELGLPIYLKKREFDIEEKKAADMIKEGTASRITMSYPEVQGKYDTICFTAEYLEMVINFGYITLFCVAFPLGPLVYWLSNLVEIKVDSYKFLNFSKRPFPERAENIGIWEFILKFITTASIFTNVALVVFHNTMLAPTWLVFVLLEHAMIGIVAFLQSYIADKDEATRNTIKRHEFLKESYAYKRKPLKFRKGKPNYKVCTDDKTN